MSETRSSVEDMRGFTIGAAAHILDVSTRSVDALALRLHIPQVHGRWRRFRIGHIVAMAILANLTRAGVGTPVGLVGSSVGFNFLKWAEGKSDTEWLRYKDSGSTLFIGLSTGSVADVRTESQLLNNILISEIGVVYFTGPLLSDLASRGLFEEWLILGANHTA